MESFLNGYLATVLLDGDKRDDKIGDLINCCYANAFHIDPRIEQALCLETLKTRVEDTKLDRETLALVRQVAPPCHDSDEWQLHLGLRTQVFLREPELSLDDAFSAEDSTDQDRGECWQNCLLVRKRYLSKILTECGNQKTKATLQKIEEAFPKDSVITALNKTLDEKSQISKEELLEVQKEACLVMKQKRVSSDLLKMMNSPSVEDDHRSMSYQEGFISIEDLARRVVYHGEEIPIPSILPSRFEKAAEKAKRRIQELREEKEAAAEQLQSITIEQEEQTSDLKKTSSRVDPPLEVFKAQLDTIAEQLESWTASDSQPPPAGDSSNEQESAELDEMRTELLERCEKMRKELELGKEAEGGGVQMNTPGRRLDQPPPLQKCLTGTPWKKKKKQNRNSANHRYSIGPSVNGHHSQTPN